MKPKMISIRFQSLRRQLFYSVSVWLAVGSGVPLVADTGAGKDPVPSNAAQKEALGLIKEVYGEAKGEGFDVKILRKVITLRKKDPEERAEEDELLELYMSAIGQ